MNERDLLVLNEQIADLARAGLPLDRGLEAIAAEMGSGPLQRIARELAVDLRNGIPLADAFRRRNVPEHYACLLEAGVRSGRIAEVLTTLSDHARSIQSMRWTLIDALFYPVMVLAVMSGMYILLVLFVLPQFAELWRLFNMKLHPLEQFVYAIHGQSALLLALFPVGLAALVFVALYVASGFSEVRRHRLTAVLYGLPLVGTMIRSARMAEFTRLFSILIAEQIPLHEALRLAGSASADPIFADQTVAMHEQLSEGRSLSETLRGQGMVPDWVVWMTGTGESRNRLASALNRIAELYQWQAERRALVLRHVLPPLMLMFLGIMIGILVFVMAAPFLRLLIGLSS